MDIFELFVEVLLLDEDSLFLAEVFQAISKSVLDHLLSLFEQPDELIVCVGNLALTQLHKFLYWVFWQGRDLAILPKIIYGHINCFLIGCDLTPEVDVCILNSRIKFEQLVLWFQYMHSLSLKMSDLSDQGIDFLVGKSLGLLFRLLAHESLQLFLL